eukprot:587025-Amorphochlora_amoeboformis.AAC.2
MSIYAEHDAWYKHVRERLRGVDEDWVDEVDELHQLNEDGWASHTWMGFTHLDGLHKLGWASHTWMGFTHLRLMGMGLVRLLMRRILVDEVDEEDIGLMRLMRMGLMVDDDGYDGRSGR